MKGNIAAMALCLFVAWIVADAGDWFGTIMLLLCAAANGVIIVFELTDRL